MALHAPVFILGAHKSGTSLLRNLLDGHPQLFTLPFESHIFQLSGCWVDYRLRHNKPTQITFDVMKENFISHITESNSSTVATADSQLQGRFDIDAFREALKKPVETFPELIELYFNAAYYNLYHTERPDTVRIVEKSVEHAEFAHDLLNMFPDARFIHVLRNPYANLAAIRRSRFVYSKRRWFKARYPSLARILHALENSLYNMERNQRLIEQYHIIRYEDLLTSPEVVMRGIAEYLDITWSDNLLHPTSIGDQWAGNSSMGIEYKGVDASNIDRWKQDITSLEIEYVNHYFSFILDKYNYQRLTTSPISFWKPNNKELPHVYILNRLIPRIL